MQVELRPLTADDVDAHRAGEDDETVRWLTGGYGSVESTGRYVEWLAGNASTGQGKQGFGVWLDGRLAGYVDYEPLSEAPTGDGVRLRAGDVNLAYAVHPWARGRGVAVAAVRLVCDLVRSRHPGSRALIQVEEENRASVGVALRAGFEHAGERTTAPTEDGHDPVTYQVYLLDL